MIEKIRNIIKWWKNCTCPNCGGDVKVDGSHHCGEWYGKSESVAFSYCANKCGFKHYLTFSFDDTVDDSMYLEQIKKILEEGKQTEKEIEDMLYELVQYKMRAIKKKIPYEEYTALCIQLNLATSSREGLDLIRANKVLSQFVNPWEELKDEGEKK